MERPGGQLKRKASAPEEKSVVVDYLGTVINVKINEKVSRTQIEG